MMYFDKDILLEFIGSDHVRSVFRRKNFFPRRLCNAQATETLNLASELALGSSKGGHQKSLQVAKSVFFDVFWFKVLMYYRVLFCVVDCGNF